MPIAFWSIALDGGRCDGPENAAVLAELGPDVLTQDPETLAAAFEARAVDEVVVLIYPLLRCTEGRQAVSGGPGVPTPQDGWRLAPCTWEPRGTAWLARGHVRYL
jgi:hypothetical protein